MARLADKLTLLVGKVGEYAANAGEATRKHEGLFVHRGAASQGARPADGLYHVYFPEGMTVDMRDALFAEITEIGAAGYAICGAMRAILQYELTEDDHARCATKDPGPAYYMLCDEEELGTHDNGNMDGDLKIRRAAGRWEVLCCVVASEVAVELLGFEGAELVCGGQMFCDFGPEPAEVVHASVFAESLRWDEPEWEKPTMMLAALKTHY